MKNLILKNFFRNIDKLKKKNYSINISQTVTNKL